MLILSLLYIASLTNSLRFPRIILKSRLPFRLVFLPCQSSQTGTSSAFQLPKLHQPCTSIVSQHLPSSELHLYAYTPFSDANVYNVIFSNDRCLPTFVHFMDRRFGHGNPSDPIAPRSTHPPRAHEPNHWPKNRLSNKLNIRLMLRPNLRPPCTVFCLLSRRRTGDHLQIRTSLFSYHYPCPTSSPVCIHPSLPPFLHLTR
jgi:hypothetical protein